jgi:hypothetical protein
MNFKKTADAAGEHCRGQLSRDQIRPVPVRMMSTGRAWPGVRIVA